MKQEAHEQSLSQGFILGQWTRVLFASLEAAGLRDVVVSPGSRSTPLVLAALARPSLRCHSVIDERAAGFFALGVARATRRPVLLLCTSGSALAHYLPALIEAHYAGIPLVVLSADRPAWLKEAGAPQTIAQEGLFGAFAHQGPVLGEPRGREQDVRALRRKVFQTVGLASGRAPGPVHLNFPVDKPLEPLPAHTDDERSLESFVSALLAESYSLSPGQVAVDEHFATEFLAGRTDTDLMILGPVEPEVAAAAEEACRALGLPLLSEYPQTNSSFPLEFLGSSLTGSGAPARILYVGPAPVSGQASRALQEFAGELWILSGPQLIDAESLGDRLFLGEITRALRSLHSAAPTLKEENGSLELWASRSRLLSKLLAVERAKTGQQMSEITVSAAVLAALVEPSHLLLANSLSVRAASWCGAQTSARVWLRRGANGIDGAFAEAVGHAQATEQPTVLLLGDVAAAHDLGSLALARGVKTPLVFVVMDNSGGRLFDFLPAAKVDLPSEHWRFWSTPPGLDFVKLAHAHDLEACLLINESDLTHALALALKRPVATLIVCPTEPEGTKRFLDSVKVLIPW